MPVAKSYQALKIIGELFCENKRQYVNVRLNNGSTKKVRWYSEQEYKRLYPEPLKKNDSPYYKSQKEVLGFSKNYITIFRGPVEDYADWFRSNGAFLTRFWGRYFKSTQQIPNDLPAVLEPVRLSWSEVGSDHDEKLIADENAIIAAVKSVLNRKNLPVKLGDSIKLAITVKSVEYLETKFGDSTKHIMEDEKGNEYIWLTAAKSWEVGSKHTISAKIKDYDESSGKPQITLHYCREIN